MTAPAGVYACGCGGAHPLGTDCPTQTEGRFSESILRHELDDMTSSRNAWRTVAERRGAHLAAVRAALDNDDPTAAVEAVRAVLDRAAWGDE